MGKRGKEKKGADLTQAMETQATDLKPVAKLRAGGEAKGKNAFAALPLDLLTPSLSALDAETLATPKSSATPPMTPTGTS